MTLHVTSVIEIIRQNNTAIVHTDEALYPLFIQALYPKYMERITSYMALANRILQDPSPEQAVFLPDFLQNRMDQAQGKLDRLFPPDHPEWLAFTVFKAQFPDGAIEDFETSYIKQQRHMLWQEGVRVVGIDDQIDVPGFHIAVISYDQSIPSYCGQTEVLRCGMDDVQPFGGQPSELVIPPIDWSHIQNKVLPVRSVRLLFNDLPLFYERYVLDVRPPYPKGWSLNTKTIKQYLLADILPQTNTMFDMYQLQTMKQEWIKFQQTLPSSVFWSTKLQSTVSDDIGLVLKGEIDLLWNDGLYVLTTTTPPSRKALLNGTQPELPLLAALYQKPLDHLGYIQIKGYGQDMVQIVRYANPQELVIQNLEKLSCCISAASS